MPNRKATQHAFLGPLFQVDSGATSHMVSNPDLFIALQRSMTTKTEYSDGRKLPVKGKGDVTIHALLPDNAVVPLKLIDVLYVTQLDGNLLLVKCATQKGCKVTFESNTCYTERNEKLLAGAKCTQGLYQPTLYNGDSGNTAKSAVVCKNKICVSLWHRQLGQKYRFH